MRISLYKEQHQEQLLELTRFYGAQNVTRMVEQLIEAAYTSIQESQGGSNDRNKQQCEAA